MSTFKEIVELLDVIGEVVMIYFAIVVLFQVGRFCRARADQLNGKIPVIQNVYLHGFNEFISKLRQSEDS